MENTKKIKFIISAFKFVLYFILFYCFSRASIGGGIAPFGFAVLFALGFCNQKLLLLIGAYILANVLIDSSLINIAITSCACFVFWVSFFVHIKTKHKMQIVLLIVYSIISQGANIFFSIGNNQALFSCLLSIIIGVLFLLCFVHFSKCLIGKKAGLKISTDEYICGAIVLICFAMGISDLQIYNIEIIKVICIFTILISANVCKNSTTIILALCFGLGQALFLGDLSLLGCFGLYALASICFKSEYRFLSVFAIILVDVTIGLYFKSYPGYDVFNLLSVVIGGVLFLLISPINFKILKVFFGNSDKKIYKDIANEERERLCTRLLELSEVFAEMNITYAEMVKGLLPANEACDLLIEEVNKKICSDCPERHKCYNVLGEQTNACLSDIVSSGFEKGKATILDVPSFLSTRCNKINVILNAINQLICSYKQYCDFTTNSDKSKILLSEQMKGVSNLLKNMAYDNKSQLIFDESKQKQICEELNYYNIVCDEVVIFGLNEKLNNIKIIVRNIGVDTSLVEKVVSKILSCPLTCTKSEILVGENCVSLTLKNKIRYDVAFGGAGTAKNNGKISGDTYSFIKVAEDKILLAICDGMGSGEQANKSSERSINLIENFYKAGFDNETILSSVNKLLTVGKDEIYSALDIAVVNLNDACTDFIKVGAVQTIIKGNENMIINSSSLPLGILEEMQPAITTKNLANGDIIIMCSDGIINRFGAIEKLNIFTQNSTTLNPQTLANEILEQALQNCKNLPDDDCTVLVARLYER